MDYSRICIIWIHWISRYVVSILNGVEYTEIQVIHYLHANQYQFVMYTICTGGELVGRMGIGVDQSSNVNAKLSILYGDRPDKHERMSLNFRSILGTDHAVRNKASELASNKIQ